MIKQNQTDIYLNKLYTICDPSVDYSLWTKITLLCEELLTIPYGMNDSTPIIDNWDSIACLETAYEFDYGFEALNCVTFVESILAAILVVNNKISSILHWVEKFESNLKSIRYKIATNNVFLARNHFMSLDWIPSNNNILTDITTDLSTTCLLYTSPSPRDS